MSLKNIRQFGVFCLLLVFSFTSFAQLSEWEKLEEQYWSASEQGHHPEALAIATRAFVVAKLREPENIPLSCFYLGNTFHEQKDYKHAETVYSYAVSLWKKLYGLNSLAVASASDVLSKNYATQKKHKMAVKFAKPAMKVLDKKYSENSLSWAEQLVYVALIYVNQGDYIKAEALIKRALDFQEKQYGAKHYKMAELTANLGYFYNSQAEYRSSKLMYQRSLAISIDLKREDLAIAAAVQLFNIHNDVEPFEEVFQHATQFLPPAQSKK